MSAGLANGVFRAVSSLMMKLAWIPGPRCVLTVGSRHHSSLKPGVHLHPQSLWHWGVEVGARLASAFSQRQEDGAEPWLCPASEADGGERK